MEKPLILLNSAPDRGALRECFLKSYDNWQFKEDYDLNVVVERGSIHLLRQREIAAQGFVRPIIIIDDDMLFTENTDFRKSIAFLENENVGMITNGWKFSENMKRSVRDEFVKRKLVFTGGGMVLSIAAQKVISKMEKIPYWSDNVAWSIETTKSGLQNYYYRGSMAIHKVCQNGGRKALLAQSRFVHHPNIDVKFGTSGQILIPTQKSIKWD